MAAKKTLSADNLEALGARRLAELLMDIAGQNAPIARRLRLELAAEHTPGKVAADIRKRLAQIGRASSFADWRKVRELALDLDTQRRAIVERVARIDAGEALELMWRLLDLAPDLHDRADDSNGEISRVFTAACDDLGPLAEHARADPAALADRVFDARLDNGYGQYDYLISTLAPALGAPGLERLKARFVELSQMPVETPPQAERKVRGWGIRGPFYEDELEASTRASTIRIALQEIATAQGDVDGYIAQYDENARKGPIIAAGIARRLLAAGRAEEALRIVEQADPPRNDWPPFDWDDARIEVLEALGRRDEAQTARWACFERTLSMRHLKAFLGKLPDFDDDEAERRALDQVERDKRLLRALTFLIGWPALDRAARQVTQRAAELDGNDYETLTTAAKALAEKHPLAATLVLRAMIDFTLTKGRSGRYRHAARHLQECAVLAPAIDDFGAFETHETYMAYLLAKHGRKSGFWALAE
jgi:tetratricopeptide (TPR) repeat protein